MQQDNTRNTIIFVVCMAVILIAYQAFVLQPQQRARQAALAQQQAVAAQAKTPADAALGGGAKQFPNRAAAVAASARIPIRTPALNGSLALTGARIDDLYLTAYREKLDPKSPPVELFTPYGSEFAYFAQSGWLRADGKPALDANAPWRPISGDVIAPGKAVVLGFDTVEGLSFRRTISVDKNAMFAIVDQVTNRTGSPVELTPYSSVQRHDLSPEARKPATNVHQGAVGALGLEPKLKTFKYKDWEKSSAKDDKKLKSETRGGWLGIADKYWLAAVIPDQKELGRGSFSVTPDKVYVALYSGAPQALAPGATRTEKSFLFAGAKTKVALDLYQKQLNLPKFEDAIDWGILWFLTKPIFWLIDTFYKLVGNFGLAIMMLTVVVRGVFFPLANQTFASGAKMKKLQPKIEEIKKRFKDDPAKLQEAQMKLFQTEKINPLAGCLPILIQIPVFLALFKVLSVTIEMRHAPFFAFIQDLSARDPTVIWNLFGLLPYDPATIPVIGGFLDGTLHIGVVCLAYAGAMALQQAMTPVSADPTQQAIMKFFPVVFMFILANYPVGLLIYWTWSTVLSLGQQYWFMRRYKVDNPIDDFLQRIGAEKRAPAG